MFRRAVDLIDSGNIAALAQLLSEQPTLIHQQTHFEDPAYFSNPTLLEFIAENPTRHGTLPPNIVKIATVLLAAEPGPNAITRTLALVASGRVARESGAQPALIALLHTYGADPTPALHAAAAHGEFEAIRALLKAGATQDLPTLAALGDEPAFQQSLLTATPEARHLALAFAAQHGRTTLVRSLLEAGEDPNRYNPEGAHAHSTPLHQAAQAGHLETVKLLLAHGADPTLKDHLWQGTPADWARHAGRKEIATLLESSGPC